MGIVAGLEEQGLDLLCDHNLSEPQVSKKDKAEGMKWGSLERREMTVAVMSVLASCLRQSSHSGAIVSVTASCCRIVEIILTIALVQILIIVECFTARRCVCSSSPSPGPCVPVCACMYTGAQVCAEKAGDSEERFPSPILFCNTEHSTQSTWETWGPLSVPVPAAISSGFS